MKSISLLFTAVLLYGCLSVISQKSANNLKIDEILIPTAQCNMCVANIENALNGVDGILKYKVGTLACLPKLYQVLRMNYFLKQHSTFIAHIQYSSS